MTRAQTHAVAHSLADCEAMLAIIEECNVLFPRKADHDIQPVVISKVEKPAGWHCVCTDCIYPRLRDENKIPLDTIRVMKLIAPFVRPESAVSDSSDP